METYTIENEFGPITCLWHDQFATPRDGECVWKAAMTRAASYCFSEGTRSVRLAEKK